MDKLTLKVPIMDWCKEGLIVISNKNYESVFTNATLYMMQRYVKAHGPESITQEVLSKIYKEAHNRIEALFSDMPE